MARVFPTKPALKMTARQYNLLSSESKKHKTANQKVKRIKILLKASQGQSNYSISKELNINIKTVKPWRDNWDLAYEKLLIFEQGKTGQGVSDTELLQEMLKVVKDKPRPGKPPVFTLSQKQQLVALACRKPSEYGLPHTRWTNEMLAHVAQTEKIVESISSRYLGEILKKYGGASA